MLAVGGAMSEPKDPGAANDFLAKILANATANAPPEAVTAGVETRVCRTCGAARPEGTDLKRCDYCGTEFQ